MRYVCVCVCVLGWSLTSGKRMPGNSRHIPRLFLECDSAWEMKEKKTKTYCRLGLEVPDILLPDVGTQPNKEYVCVKRKCQKERCCTVLGYAVRLAWGIAIAGDFQRAAKGGRQKGVGHSQICSVTFW